MKLTYKQILALLFAFGLVLAPACGSDKDEDDDQAESSEEDESQTLSEAGGSTGSVGANLTSVNSNMLPAALSSDSTSLLLSGDNPCANASGLFDCQPNLLKTYMKISKDMVYHVGEIVKKTAVVLNQFEVGSSGEQQGGPGSIKYKIESAQKYKIILKSDKGRFAFLNVNEERKRKRYVVKWNSANAPSDGGRDSGGGKAKIVISYVNNNDFWVNASISDMDCSDSDVRAPQKLIVKISKKDNKWSGKAMVMSPRWNVANGTTCSFEPTSDSKMFMYTDFVSSNDNATASVYLMPSSVSDMSQFSSYDASKFCTNYPGSCSSGYAFGDSNLVSSYTNPFCANSSSASWGAACSDLPVTDYSESSNWVMPSDLDQVSESVPENF